MSSLNHDQVEAYLADAESKAITAMAQNKWVMFGYWAAQSVHLRKLLKMTHKPSPFRAFADLARKLKTPPA